MGKTLTYDGKSYTIDSMRTLEKTFCNDMIRVIDKDGQPWFVVSDVCKALGLSNPTESIKNHDDDDLCTAEVIDSMKRKQIVNIVNEPGLYELIFKSRKKEAKSFKRWVVSEVLPQIRKTGEYRIPANLKKISTENRKVLTDIWRDCGIEKKHHFIQLTLQEYKALGIDKKKAEMTKGEILLLSALESMEALKLFNDPKGDYYSCRDSLHDTAKVLPNKELDRLEKVDK